MSGDDAHPSVRQRITGEAARVGREALRLASRFPLSALALGGARTARWVAGSWWRERRVPVAGLPLARPSAAAVAQVAIDECVLAVMNNPSREPDRADLLRVAREADAAVAQFAREGWLDDPTTYHPAPPALERPAVAPARWLDVRYEKVIFESGYEPHPGEPGRERWLGYAPNRVGYAWALRHRDGSRPWVVCVHGFGTGRPFMDFQAFRAAFLHRAYGLNVVLPVLPLHGPRNIGGMSGAAFMGHDLMNVVHGMAQSVWDIRRVLSWVRSQAPTAVGVYGVSLGSYVGSLLAGLEPDLDCVIAGVPVCDLPSLYLHHAPERLRRTPEAAALMGEVGATALQVVSPLAVTPMAAWDRRFLYAGLVDRMATPAQARRLWEHWDRPRMTWYDGNHVGFLWSRDVGTLVRGALESTGLTRRAA